MPFLGRNVEASYPWMGTVTEVLVTGTGAIPPKAMNPRFGSYVESSSALKEPRLSATEKSGFDIRINVRNYSLEGR